MKESGTFFGWNNRPQLKVILELAVILAPVLIVLFTLSMLFFLFRSRPEQLKQLDDQRTNYMIDRIYSAPHIPSDEYLQALTSYLHWDTISINYPDSWIHFFEKKIGGRALTIQPSVDASTGIHLQNLGRDNDGSIQSEQQFLNAIGMSSSTPETINIGGEDARLYPVSYLTQFRKPMSGYFIFVQHDQSVYRIVVFYRTAYAAYFDSLYRSILSTLSFVKSET